jgi:hypothetical protein
MLLWPHYSDLNSKTHTLLVKSRDSSVGIALGYGVLGFDSRRGLGSFLFTTLSKTALGPTQPPIQWVPGALFLGDKRPRREADHSPPSSVEVKEWVELYVRYPNTPSWRGAYLSTGTTLPWLFTFYTLLVDWFAVNKEFGMYVCHEVPCKMVTCPKEKSVLVRTPNANFIKLTNSTERIPSWEAYSYSACQ